MSATDRPDWANYPPYVATAYDLVVRHHAGQVDKAGAPYLGHVVAVAEKCRRHGYEAVAAGLLHDIVEDTDVTLDDLRSAGMPDVVVAAVDAVTRRPGETYDDLITRAAAHRLGRLVKLADIANNSDPARLALLDERQRAWFTAKYAKARNPLEHPMCLDVWQQPDGFPTDAYFQSVADALAEAGVEVESWEREEDHETNYTIARASYRDGPLGDYEDLIVSWRTDQDDEPNGPDDFTGMGWYWVPFSDAQKALGDYAEQFGLSYLAEPEEVAASVRKLVLGNNDSAGTTQ